MNQVHDGTFSMHFSFNPHKCPESGVITASEILEGNKGQLKWGDGGEFDGGYLRNSEQG